MHKKTRCDSQKQKQCALTVVTQSQNSSPAANPLPGGAGWGKFNQLQMFSTFIYKPSSVRINACNFELSSWQTDKHTTKPTDSNDYNTLCCSFAKAQCNYHKIQSYNSNYL